LIEFSKRASINGQAYSFPNPRIRTVKRFAEKINVKSGEPAVDVDRVRSRAFFLARGAAP
jgi:hypothetical protein